MLGFSILGAAFLAFILTTYVVAAAEEGLWPFHRFRRAPKGTNTAVDRELIMKGPALMPADPPAIRPAEIRG